MKQGELRHQTWDGNLWYDPVAHSIAYDQTPPSDDAVKQSREVFDLYHSDGGMHWREVCNRNGKNEHVINSFIDERDALRETCKEVLDKISTGCTPWELATARALLRTAIGGIDESPH